MNSGWCNNWVTRQHARCNNENRRLWVFPVRYELFCKQSGLKGYFALLQASVVLTEEYNVKANSEQLAYNRIVCEICGSHSVLLNVQVCRVGCRLLSGKWLPKFGHTVLLSCSSNLRGRELASVDWRGMHQTVRTVGVCVLVAKTVISEDLRPQKKSSTHIILNHVFRDIAC